MFLIYLFEIWQTCHFSHVCRGFATPAPVCHRRDDVRPARILSKGFCYDWSLAFSKYVFKIVGIKNT